MALEGALSGDPAEWFALAEEMEEKYPHYAAQMGTRKRALAGLPLSVAAASADDRDIEIAAFLESQLPVLRAALFDMGDAIAKGMAVFEIEWASTGGKWTISRLTRVDPRWLKLDKNDLSTPRLLSDEFPDGEPLEPGRFFVLTMPQKSGLPLRGGIAWTAVWPFLFQHFSLKDWLTFVERFGKPVRLGVFEDTASEADIDTLRQAVAAIGQDLGAVISASTRLEFPAGGEKGSGDWQALLNYLDAQVSKLILGQTLSADAESTGLGSGVAKLQGEVRGDILAADAAMLEEAINAQLTAMLLAANFGQLANPPRITLAIEESEDLAARMEVVKTAVELGFKVSTSWFSEAFKIPLLEEGESALQPLAVQPAVLAHGNLSGAALAMAESPDPALAAARARGEELDELAQFAAADWQPVLDPLLAPVLEAIAEAADQGETAEEVLKRLPALLEQMDDRRLTESLTRAGFVARAAGLARG